jgi:hypothetical protein
LKLKGRNDTSYKAMEYGEKINCFEKTMSKNMSNILCPLWLNKFQNSKEKNGGIKL